MKTPRHNELAADVDYEIPEGRRKTRRDRIKSHRAKRHRRRFYVIVNGEERARDTGIRSGPSKTFTAHTNNTEPTNPMISTRSGITNVRLSADSPLLAQVTAPLGNAKYRVGKLAYDYLASIADRPAQELSDNLARLGYSSIGERDLTAENEAALAVAAAAILDSSKGRRLTVSEQLEAACDYLDSELAAGW